MNSLPRWLIKKEKKEKINNSYKSSVISAPGYTTPIHEAKQDNSASNRISPNSRMSLTSDETELKEENLYVNGQVPRGHFTEYFMSKESLESVPEIYQDEVFKTAKSLKSRQSPTSNTSPAKGSETISGPVEDICSSSFENPKSETAKPNILAPENCEGNNKFNFGSPNQLGLPSSEETGNYYNVRVANRARSTVELARQDHLSFRSQQIFCSQATLDIKDVKKQRVFRGSSTPNILDNNYDEVGSVQEYANAIRSISSTTSEVDVGCTDEDSGSQDSGAVFAGGNHYGTPRPSGDSSLRPEVAPGQHPSSEGKRRRNRSNVEAMASKHLDNSNENNGGSPDSGVTDQSSLPKASDGGGGDEEGLGPLPPNWEKAYTDKGEQYFIDHNSGTSHWLDPRLSRVQKQRPEDCEDNELPFGWERIDDPHYGTYYIDHVNRRTQYENPVLAAKAANQSADGIKLGPPPSPPAPPAPTPFSRPNKSENDRPFFTRDPGQLRGEKLQAKLVKSSRGLGFTIVGGDDSEEEFLQIKSVVPNGPAWLDGRLKTGDVLCYVNGVCVLGFTHHDMVTMFQNINPGEVVKLDVCRGYPLPFDPDDPNTEIVTTVAVNSPDNTADLNSNTTDKLRSEMDSTASMPDLWRSQPPANLAEERPRPGSADLLMETPNGGGETYDESNPDQVTIPIVKGGMGFGFTIADSAYGQKVKKILDRPRCKSLHEGDILVEINSTNVANMNHNNVVQVLKDCPRGQEAAITIQRGYSLNRAKKKAAAATENGGLRPKSGFLFRSKTPTAHMTQEKEVVPIRPKTPVVDTRNMAQKNWNTEQNLSSPFSRNDMSRASLGVGGGGSFDMLADQLGMTGLKDHRPMGPRSHSPGRELDGPGPHHHQLLQNGYDSGYGYSGYNGGEYPPPQMGYGAGPGGENQAYRAGSLPRPRKDSAASLEQQRRPADEVSLDVVLLRHDSGFGFRIVGGTEEGSQVSIGHIVPGGAADMDGRLFSGDEIVAVDNQSVIGASHHEVVNLMGISAQRGQVQITIRRRQFQESYRDGYPYDVTVSRLENEGFGFVIISSVSRAGSTIGRIIQGSPAERCGRLQVGDRILAVNHVDINSLHHEKIINIIKESGYSVTLTVGPPIDDSSSTASTSHRSSSSSMVTGWARPVVPPADSLASSRSSSMQRSVDVREGTPGEGGAAFPPSAAAGPGAPGREPGAPPISTFSSNPTSGWGELHFNYYQQEDQEVGAHLGEDDQYFAVELGRGNRGFGFSIRGGREFHSMPLFVLRMAVDGPAAADGRLRVGDQLTEINGQSTRNMTHAEAIETIKNGGATVRLLVKRGKVPPPAMLDQSNLSPSSITPLPQQSGQPHLRPVSSLSQPNMLQQQSVQFSPTGHASQQQAFSPPYQPNATGGVQPYMGGGGVAYNAGYAPSSPGGEGVNGPVSHSSPRYPPPHSQYFAQQPYWGYTQSVE